MLVVVREKNGLKLQEVSWWIRTSIWISDHEIRNVNLSSSTVWIHHGYYFFSLNVN